MFDKNDAINRARIKSKMDKFREISNNPYAANKIRDKIHNAMNEDVLIVAKASALVFDDMPPGMLRDLMLAAMIEAAIAFLLIQGKIIIKEESR